MAGLGRTPQAADDRQPANTHIPEAKAPTTADRGAVTAS
jgi:hypothetical protein